MTMFVVMEVHPFLDGSGRTARLAMNCVLSTERLSRIIIPTVYRGDYLLPLKALSHHREAQPLLAATGCRSSCSSLRASSTRWSTCSSFPPARDAGPILTAIATWQAGTPRTWDLDDSCLPDRKGYNSHMEKATVSKLKNNLSAYLRKVRSGQPVLIYDRDLPIARIERIETSGRGADRLALLAAQGITRPAGRPLSPRELRSLLPRLLPRAARVVDALMDERASDR